MTEQEVMNEALQNGADTVAPAEAPVETAASGQAAGMMNKLKDSMNVHGIMDKIRHSKDKLFEAGLYAGIGFISGFLLKKYSTYVVVCILLLIGLGVLQQLEVIDVVVNWDKVNELFGIQAAQSMTADNIISLVWEWVSLNLVISISYLVGLFIGLKVG